jgi:hypothetical protein
LKGKESDRTAPKLRRPDILGTLNFLSDQSGGRLFSSLPAHAFEAIGAAHWPEIDGDCLLWDLLTVARHLLRLLRRFS